PQYAGIGFPAESLSWPLSCLTYWTNPCAEWQRLQLADGLAVESTVPPAPSLTAVSRFACFDCRQSETRSWLLGLSWQTAQAATENSCTGFTMLPSGSCCAVACVFIGPWQLSHCIPAKAFTLAGTASQAAKFGAAVTWSYDTVVSTPFVITCCEVAPVRLAK